MAGSEAGHGERGKSLLCTITRFVCFTWNMEQAPRITRVGLPERLMRDGRTSELEMVRGV